MKGNSGNAINRAPPISREEEADSFDLPKQDAGHPS